jgi:hypothetical protein
MALKLHTPRRNCNVSQSAKQFRFLLKCQSHRHVTRSILTYLQSINSRIYVLAVNKTYNLEMAAVGEAHCLKNADTNAHATITWLEISFLILETASVLPNRLSDLAGYVKFLGASDELWEPWNLRNWGLTSLCNPYTLPEDHPATILRTTPRAVAKYTTGPKVSPQGAGAYLALVYKGILIRRTYPSPVTQSSIPRPIN